MSGIKITASTVYAFYIDAVVCQCTGPHNAFATGKKLANVVQVAEGYYALYLAFWGDQLVWLRFTVVDVRDGQVMWRDGRHLPRSNDGKIAGTEPTDE